MELNVVIQTILIYIFKQMEVLVVPVGPVTVVDKIFRQLKYPLSLPILVALKRVYILFFRENNQKMISKFSVNKAII